jgi:hypothetical protein
MDKALAPFLEILVASLGTPLPCGYFEEVRFILGVVHSKGKLANRGLVFGIGEFRVTR